MPLTVGVAETLFFSTRGCCCQSGRGRQKGGDEILHCPTEYTCQVGIFIWDSSSKRETWEMRKAKNSNTWERQENTLNSSQISSNYFAFITIFTHVCFVCPRDTVWVRGEQKQAKILPVQMSFFFWSWVGNPSFNEESFLISPSLSHSWQLSFNSSGSEVMSKASCCSAKLNTHWKHG